MKRKWLSWSHRSVNVKYSTSKGVSLSKCCFHFRMCSAISAAATHSVPAVQSRFGPRTSPGGAEVQGCTRALPAQRGWVSAQSPQQHPCLQLCNEDPGTAVEGCLQLLRPQATTVAWYSPVRALQKPHKEFQPQLDTVPASPPTPQAPTLHWGIHPKELCCVILHTALSSAVQVWLSPTHRANITLGVSSNRNSILKVQISMRPRTQQVVPLLPTRRAPRCHRGHSCQLPCTQPARHLGSHWRGLLSLAFISTSQFV